VNIAIDDAFVRKMDAELITQGVPLHARPFQVAISYMQSVGLSGDFLSDALWTPLMEIYHRSYPSGDFSIPAVLIGGVGFRDQFYTARVSVGYGRFSIDPLKCIDIDPLEMTAIWQRQPDQVWRAMYSVCDLWDFGYAVDDLRNENAEVVAHFQNARAAVVATARTLSNSGDSDFVVQSICQTAELSMKGVLVKLGWPESKRRNLGRSGHGLSDIAAAIASERPSPSDERLFRAVASFPDYVQTRYASHGLKRIELVELAMKAQYVAADALRRISGRNLAGTIEQESNNPPRSFP
jgi:hypothetical protein